MSYEEIYSFVFKGLLTEEALDKGGRKTKKHFRDPDESEAAERLGIPQLDDDLVAKAKKMAVVYTAICAFENSVREFIQKKMSEEKKEKWWDTCVNAEVRKKAESRRDTEKDVRWLTPRGNSPIYYTDFGDLISIIAKPDNWSFFEVHIKKIDWAKQIIETLEKSRNIIMHGGELSERDVERVGMYIRDWVDQVG